MKVVEELNSSMVFVPYVPLWLNSFVPHLRPGAAPAGTSSI